MKLLLASISLSLINLYASEVCTIETYPKIIKVSEKVSSNSEVIKNSNCDRKLQNNFRNIIQEKLGSVRSFSLSDALSSPLTKVNISPTQIHIYDLKSVMQSKKYLTDEKSISNIKFVEKKSVIALDEGDQFDIFCTNCTSTGERNFKLEVQKFSSGVTNVKWFTANLDIKINAIIAKKRLDINYQAIKREDFEIKRLQTSRPQDYFTDFSKIDFFQLNNKILKGDFLKKSSVTPIQLIRHGIPTTVRHSNNNISLEAVAIPLESGKYGEIIRLRNRKSKKIVFGKVVGHNKVVIEL